MSETVKGLKKLIATLEKIPPEMDDKVSIILEANAREIESGAKQRAPVDTGKLQQSIKSIKIGKLEFKIYANSTGLAPYAIYLEYGTRKMRKQPFLFPAYFAQRPRLIKDLEKLIKDTFGKI